jgi:hypothetical protein
LCPFQKGSSTTTDIEQSGARHGARQTPSLGINARPHVREEPHQRNPHPQRRFFPCTAPPVPVPVRQSPAEPPERAHFADVRPMERIVRDVRRICERYRIDRWPWIEITRATSRTLLQRPFARRTEECPIAQALVQNRTTPAATNRAASETLQASGRPRIDGYACSGRGQEAVNASRRNDEGTREPSGCDERGPNACSTFVMFRMEPAPVGQDRPERQRNAVEPYHRARCGALRSLLCARQ